VLGKTRELLEQQMSVINGSHSPRHTIAPGRERYHASGAQLMVVVLDFNDGPSEQPDTPHSHPHEQITYVESGRVLFFLGDAVHELMPGDLITIPPNVPHAIQLLTPSARLIDTFTPVREDILNNTRQK
jgi:quercetin dioxygenase-like cupin family protein